MSEISISEILDASITALTHLDRARLEELVEDAGRAESPATTAEGEKAAARLRLLAALLRETSRNQRLISRWA